jgi:flagellar biosynthesis anti-sigma factor FlgM
MNVHRVDGPGGPRRLEPTASARPAKAPEVDRPGTTDRVEVSAEARRIAALSAAASERQGIREGRVEELRKSIALGTHEVDPRALARAIVEFEDGLAR